MLWVATHADANPVNSDFWNFDHFYPIYGDSSGPCLESWVTLSAIAQATSRIRIGCMVNGVHYRHPAVVANMASGLDIISDGRFELGLGAGWNQEESGAYGIHLGSLTQRFDRFDEALAVIVSLLHKEKTSFHGKYFRLQRLLIIPKVLKINCLSASVEREKEGRSLMWLNMLLTGIFRLTKKLSLPTNLIPLSFIVMKLRGISMRSRFLPIFC